MGNVRIAALGFGSLILALGCDDGFVLGDERLPDSLNGGSSGISGSHGQSGGGSGGDAATEGNEATGGSGGGVPSSPPVTGGNGATGGTLEVVDCGRTSLPMIDGPDAIATAIWTSLSSTGSRG